MSRLEYVDVCLRTVRSTPDYFIFPLRRCGLAVLAGGLKGLVIVGRESHPDCICGGGCLLSTESLPFVFYSSSHSGVNNFFRISL